MIIKNQINKFLEYYKNNTEKFLNNLILFVIGPIILIYLAGFEKGILKYYIVMIIVFIIPFILNSLLDYIRKRKKLDKTFYIMFILFGIWITLNTLVYMQDMKNLLYIISIGIVFFILYKITKIL